MINIEIYELFLMFIIFSSLTISKLNFKLILKIFISFVILIWGAFIVNNYIFHNYVLLNYIMIIFTSIIVSFILKEKIVRSLVTFSAAYIIVAFSMYISIIFLNLLYLIGLDWFEGNIFWMKAEDIIIFILSFMTLIIIKVSKFNINKIFDNHIIIAMLIVNILIFTIGLEGIVQARGDRAFWLEIIITGISVLIFNSYLANNIYKIINENNEKILKLSYNPLLEELVDTFRANEHEYKNHLATLYAMTELNTTNKEVKKYIDQIAIASNNNLNKIINITNNPLKAILFSKIKECEKLGIKLNLDISTNGENIDIEDTKIVVIVSNLFNNAIEEGLEKANHEINFKLEKNKILISNKAENLKVSDLNKIFNKKYSSKCSDKRGYGLYNVKKIVDNGKGKINLSLDKSYLYIEISF